MAELPLAEGAGSNGSPTICRQQKSGARQENVSRRIQTVGMAIHSGMRGSVVLSLSDLGERIIPVPGVAGGLPCVNGLGY